MPTGSPRTSQAGPSALLERGLPLRRSHTKGVWPIKHEQGVDDDDNLIWSGTCAASGRPYQLIAHLDADEDVAHDFGDIELLVELDNRIGYLELVHDTEEPDPGYHLAIAEGLWVSATEPETREWMRGAAQALGPAFASEVRAYLSHFEHYDLRARSSSLSVGMVANIDWEDDDWIDYRFDLAGEVAALSSIAGILEANLPDTFTTCRYCQARFNAARAARCRHCGAPL